MRHLNTPCVIGCLLIASLVLSGCMGGHTGHNRSYHHGNSWVETEHHAPAPAFGGGHSNSGRHGGHRK
jgi:hypothetical protein